MREILFRGQTRRYGEKVRMNGGKVPGRWVYGGVLQGSGDHSIIYGCENADDPGEGLDKWTVYTDTLGQYTGLKDKNGKRIFEGDVVRATNGHISKVVYWYDGFSLYCKCHNQHSDGVYHNIVEVIGNIHDNPELLKGEWQ